MGKSTIELPHGFKHETPQLKITVSWNLISFPFMGNQSNLRKSNSVIAINIYIPSKYRRTLEKHNVIFRLFYDVWNFKIELFSTLRASNCSVWPNKTIEWEEVNIETELFREIINDYNC